MPIYEYVCRSCAYRFEVKQSIKDAPLTSCGRCGREVAKVISAPAIMFKGSGWYITDYSDKMKPPSETSDATQAPKADNASPAPAPGSATPATPAAASSQPAGTGTTPATSGTTGSTPSSAGSKT